MNTDTLLFASQQRKDEVRKAVLEKLEKSENDVTEDLRLLKSWFQYQKHLPETPCDAMLELFLIVNKFNLEKCKKKLGNYFSIRKEIPNLYVNKNPKLGHMVDIANTVYTIPLPKLTPSLSRVTIMKLKDTDPSKFHALNYFAHTYNIIEIRIREDTVLTDTIVYDMEGIQLGHLFQLGVGTLKKSATVLEKVFSSRVEGIHYVNLPSSMQILVNIVKTLLREKMRKRIHVHKDVQSLQRYICEDVLPQDYGGSELSLDKLHELWLEKLKENQSLFDHLETFTSPIDRGVSPETEEQDKSILSVGTEFKNLCVD